LSTLSSPPSNDFYQAIKIITTELQLIAKLFAHELQLAKHSAKAILALTILLVMFLPAFWFFFCLLIGYVAYYFLQSIWLALLSVFAWNLICYLICWGLLKMLKKNLQFRATKRQIILLTQGE
jgi:hypothetical protein